MQAPHFDGSRRSLAAWSGSIGGAKRGRDGARAVVVTFRDRSARRFALLPSTLAICGWGGGKDHGRCFVAGVAGKVRAEGDQGGVAGMVIGILEAGALLRLLSRERSLIRLRLFVIWTSWIAIRFMLVSPRTSSASVCLSSRLSPCCSAPSVSAAPSQILN